MTDRTNDIGSDEKRIACLMKWFGGLIFAAVNLGVFLGLGIRGDVAGSAVVTEMLSFALFSVSLVYIVIVDRHRTFLLMAMYSVPIILLVCLVFCMKLFPGLLTAVLQLLMVVVPIWSLVKVVQHRKSSIVQTALLALAASTVGFILYSLIVAR